MGFSIIFPKPASFFYISRKFIMASSEMCLASTTTYLFVLQKHKKFGPVSNLSSGGHDFSKLVFGAKHEEQDDDDCDD